MSLKIKCFVTFVLIFVFTLSKAQDVLLSRKVNMSSDNKSIKNTLRDIGSSTDIKFSYNTEIIKGDSLISYNFNNISVEDCLDTIFNDNIRYKVSGDHIILLKTTEKKAKKHIHTITGTITDSQSKQKIQYVSVYDVDEKYSTITNANGFYILNIPSGERYRGLSYCKKGYIDTIIVIRSTEKSKIDIELEPSITINPPKFQKVEPIVEERPLSSFFIPQEVIINADNLEHVSDTRFAQVSLLPSIGTNLSSYGVVENNFSFNILAGYSKGVKGIEIGSLLNIVKENVSGLQIGGLGNMVGGKLTGVQTGGLFNVNTKSINGVQLSGLINTALDTVTGVQLSGISNILKGRMNGAQVTGIYNMTTKNVDGTQLSGFANIALEDVKLMQISGFTNIGNNVDGVQIAGFANFSKGKVGGAQIAGFANFARSVNFAQISGFMNIACEEIKGAQISTFLNFANEVKGLQLALFNVSDTVSGLSLGLLSYVNKGFHKFEISGDETFYVNLAFKTGTKRFYNILAFGIDPVIFDFTQLDSVKFNSLYTNNRYGGYGFGTEITTKTRLFFGLDLTGNQILEDKSFTESFTTLFRLNISVGIRIFKKSGISIGPTLNYLISNHKDEAGNYFSTVPPPYSKTEIQSSFLTSTWIGGRLAVRI